MAWDTERTRRLLLDAAVAEFAEHGPQGARVARVADRAGVNKERIYQYFGSKEKLFDAVLEAELAKLAAAVPLTDAQAADLGDYAGRVFDYHLSHPHVPRLLAWEGLLPDPPGSPAGVAAESERTAYYAAKTAAVAHARDAGALTREVGPDRLMYAVIALVTAWTTLPQLARMLAVPGGDDSPAARRAALVVMVRRLARADSAGRVDPAGRGGSGGPGGSDGSGGAGAVGAE